MSSIPFQTIDWANIEKVIAIPNKNYFYQLNFTDGQTGEDCNEEFDALIQTIKVNTVK